MINHNILGYQMFRQNPYFHFWPQIEEDATQKKKCFIWYSSLVDLLAHVINPEIRYPQSSYCYYAAGV